MPKKLVRIISIILALSVLPGCWSRREIEDLAIISAMAIDRVNLRGQEKFRVAIQVVRPGQLGGGQRRGDGGGGGKSPGWLAAGFGETMYDAVRNLGTRSSRSMVLYHDRVIIIGEKTARQGMAEVLDFISRHKDIRLRTWIVLTEGEALPVLQSTPEMEKLLSDEISEILIRTAPRVSKGFAVDLREFISAMVTPGIDAVATKLEVMNVTEVAGEDPAVRVGEALKSVRLHGLAVFRRDRLVGWLGDNETKGFLYIKGRTGSGIIPVKVGGEEEREISFLMTRAKSKIIARVEGGKVSVTVKIEAEGDLAETESTKPIAAPEMLAQVNRDVAREIRSMALAAVKKAQKEYKADIFGFGQKVHKADPKYWHQVEDKWNDIYPTVDVKIQVTAQIRRTGMIAEPYEIK